MKTRPFITERLLMGRKESNQTKQKKLKTSKKTRYVLKVRGQPVHSSRRFNYKHHAIHWAGVCNNHDVPIFIRYWP